MLDLDGLNLNLGCGTTKFKNCVNIDIEKAVEPDLVHDFMEGLPMYESGTVDRVFMFHIIEHIQEKHHDPILFEVYRVLKPDGLFIVSYPEFIKVAQYYIDNKRGNRDYWKKAIYGRGLYPSDTHVALMDSRFFVEKLETLGFEIISIKPEDVPNEFSTVVKAIKHSKFTGIEDVINREVLGLEDVVVNKPVSE